MAVKMLKIYNNDTLVNRVYFNHQVKLICSLSHDYELNCHIVQTGFSFYFSNLFPSPMNPAFSFKECNLLNYRSCWKQV